MNLKGGTGKETSVVQFAYFTRTADYFLVPVFRSDPFIAPSRKNTNLKDFFFAFRRLWSAVLLAQ